MVAMAPNTVFMLSGAKGFVWKQLRSVANCSEGRAMAKSEHAKIVCVPIRGVMHRWVFRTAHDSTDTGGLEVGGSSEVVTRGAKKELISARGC